MITGSATSPHYPAVNHLVVCDDFVVFTVVEILVDSEVVFEVFEDSDVKVVIVVVNGVAEIVGVDMDVEVLVSVEFSLLSVPSSFKLRLTGGKIHFRSNSFLITYVI